MSTPEDNGAGMLNGHGVGIALIAIFVGMALVVAFAASDGAIFGLNSSSPSGGAGDLSNGVFDEEPGAENADAGTNVASTPERSRTTLSEEERRLLAMSNFYWDPIAKRYVAFSQDAMNKFDQQNFTRPNPVQSGAEPLSLSDRISVDVDRDRDDDIINIETPVDTPSDDDEEQEEQPQDDAGEQEDEEESGSDSGSESGDEDDQSNDQDDSGTGSNSTGTNSTSTEGPSESSGSGNDTSSDNSDIEASISIG